MPELPDVMIYVEALERRVGGQALQRIRVRSPFLVRTFEPPLEAAESRKVVAVERLGKRVVLALEGDMFLVIHLMIAGRLRWSGGGETSSKPTPAPGKIELARFEFETGILILTEAGSKKRASLHLISGRDALASLSRGGLEVVGSTLTDFARPLRAENHTLKRSLADPRLFSGIGNAYSDEILHAAKLPPTKLSQSLTAGEVERLHRATIDTLTLWQQRLRAHFGMDTGIGRFPGPGDITAFRPDFAVHGRFGLPCPVCGTKVQRIIYAENECNYCPVCQTGGKVLADRSLSRLLGEDRPRRVEEL